MNSKNLPSITAPKGTKWTAHTKTPPCGPLVFNASESWGAMLYTK